MKRFLFRLSILVLLLCLGVLAVGTILTHLAYGRVAKALHLRSESFIERGALQTEMDGITLHTEHWNIAADHIALPRVPLIFSEMIFRRAFFGGIRFGKISIYPRKIFRKNGDVSNSVGESAPLGENELRKISYLLRSPLFLFPRLTIDEILLSDSPVVIHRLSLEKGRLSFELRNGDMTVLRLSFPLRSLRMAIQEVLQMQQQEDGDGLALAVFPGVLKHLQGSIFLKDFPVSICKKFLPRELRPEGMLNAEIQITNGQWGGNFLAERLQTRPISGINMLRELRIALKFLPESIALEEARAVVGSGEWRATGEIRHHNWENFAFNIHSSGENLTFFRRNGMMIRGDADTDLKTENGQTKLSGAIKLSNSFWITEGFNFRGKSVPDIRLGSHLPLPPSWNLDISIDGGHFLRMRTAYLQGMLSAHLDITGTSAIPIIYGNLFTEKASILFPFATFDVKSGSLALSPQSRDPLWSVLAETRLHGYNLQLTIGGYGFPPTFYFSSSPAIHSGDIIAMIMAGRSPRKDGSFIRSPSASLASIGSFLGSGFFADNFIQKVRVQTGRDVTESGKETLEVEYTLDDRNSILMESDRFGRQSVDYRFKIFSK